MGPNPMPRMKNLVLRVQKNNGVKGLVIMGYKTKRESNPCEWNLF
jgi:hypothetical protein